jgi:FMN phosphatase YigB (HAD superfamily)
VRFTAVIFDLDDTLVDTTKLMLPHAIEEAIEQMQRSGLPGTSQDLLESWHRIQFKNSRADLFSELTSLYLTPTHQKHSAIVEAGKNAFYHREIKEEIQVFAGLMEVLTTLGHSHKLFLVTSGVPKTQIHKIEKLGIQFLFKKIIVTNPLIGETKQIAFRNLISEFKLDPKKVLVVGNRLDSEIVAGNNLGCSTCLVRHGEHRLLNCQNENEKPEFEIENILEIKNLCKL